MELLDKYAPQKSKLLSAKYLADNRGRLEADVVAVTLEIDYEVARCKLDAMGVGIDSLSREQAEYLGK